jgi:hypothetical protein
LAAQQTSIVNGKPRREVRVDWPLDLRGKREDEKCNRYKRARDHFFVYGEVVERMEEDVAHLAAFRCGKIGQ